MSIDLATSKLSKPIKSETKSSPMTNEKIDVASNNKPPKSQISTTLNKTVPNEKENTYTDENNFEHVTKPST